MRSTNRKATTFLPLLAGFIALAAGLYSRSGSAHGSILGEEDQQLVHIDPRPQSVRIGYVILLSRQSAQKLRQGADVNRDGRIDEKEKARLIAGVEKQVRQGLKVTIDGKMAELSLKKKKLGAEEGRAGGAVSLRFDFRLALPDNQRHRVELRDGYHPPRGAHWSARVFAASKPAEVLSIAGPAGALPKGRNFLKLEGPPTAKSPHLLKLEVKGIGNKPQPTWRTWLGWGLPALTLLGLSALALSRRRSPEPQG